MSDKVKKYIIFAVFFLVLILFSLTQFFSKDLLWPASGEEKYFNGIIFQNPTNIEDLVVSRSVEKDGKENLIKYDISFNYKGEDSTARIMGLPVRQIFFNNEITPIKSIASLKGDYEKVNNTLFTAKLKLKDFYKKDDQFTPLSTIRIPLIEEKAPYSFTIYYKASSLYFSGGRKVEDTSVFITNARMSDFRESTKSTDSLKEAFNDSGYYVNKLELINDKFVSRINILNTLSTIVFLGCIAFVCLLIWLNKKNNLYYLIPMFVMIPTFYRFIGKGTRTIAILIIYPILGFIASYLSKLLTKDELKIETKDLKQSLAYTIAYFAICIILFIVPRAFL